MKTERKIKYIENELKSYLLIKELIQYHEQERERKTLEIDREIYFIREDMKAIKGVDMTRQGNQRNPTKDKYIQPLDHIVKLEETKAKETEKHNLMIEEYKARKEKIDNVLDALEPEERDIIKYMYIDLVPYQYIANNILFCTRQNLYRVRDRILKKLFELYL